MIPCTLFIFKNINLKTIEIIYLTLDKLKGTLITDWNFKEDIWYWNNRNSTEKIGLTHRTSLEPKWGGYIRGCIS